MNEYDAYRLYVGLKLHFYSGYDFFKYGGKNKHLTVESFQKRNDHLLFISLAKYYDPAGLCVSNFLVRDVHISDLVKMDECKRIHKDWKRRMSSLSYLFSEEIKHLKKDGPSNFETDGSSHPHIIRCFLAQRISIETLLITTELTGMKAYLDKKLHDDIVWTELSLKLARYAPFLSYPKEKMRKMLLSHFSETK